MQLAAIPLLDPAHVQVEKVCISLMHNVPEAADKRYTGRLAKAFQTETGPRLEAAQGNRP
jgi:hypothetical protein